MKKSKRIISWLLCLILVLSYVQLSIFAIVTPNSENITTTVCSISISGINSNSYASMTSSTSMSLSIKMELQKNKSGTYTTIKTWTTSDSGRYIVLEKSRAINVLATYRLKVTFTAGSETLVRYAYP